MCLLKFSAFVKTIVSYLNRRIDASSFVYVAYLLEVIHITLDMNIPCAHCHSILNIDGKNKKCCSLKNNIRFFLSFSMIISELLIVLFRVSLHLGSNYSLTDDQMNGLFQTLGISCRQDYYQDIKDSVISKIDVSFSITKYENYVADKVLSLVFNIIIDNCFSY